jgi:hypothetical protein
VPGRYGGVIGGEDDRCAKKVELNGPLRGRILCRGVNGAIKHATVKRTAGISWGFLYFTQKCSVRQTQSLRNRHVCREAGKRRAHSPIRRAIYEHREYPLRVAKE